MILAAAANLPRVLKAMAKHDPAALLATDPDGEQALYWTIEAQAHEAAKFLVDRGLNPLRLAKHQGHYDHPFSRAMERRDMRMVKLLLDHIPSQNLHRLESILWKVADISDIA